jgi:hypothetical protein
VALLRQQMAVAIAGTMAKKRLSALAAANAE